MADSQDEQTQQLGGLTVPPLPAHETTATSGTETETPQLAPEQTAALGAVADTTAAQGQATQAAAVPLTQQAQTEADTAKAQADQQAKITAAKNAEDDRQLARIAAATDVYKQANDAIKAQPPVALGADRNTWGKLTLALGAALSGFGDALNARATVLGGHDVRSHFVKDMIDSDLERQREMVAKLKDNQLIALTGVKDAQQARELALSRIDMKGAEMAKQLQLRGEALTKAAGVNTPALQAKLDALKLDEHAAEFRSQAVSTLTQKMSRKSGVSNTDRDQAAKADASSPVMRDENGNVIGTAPNARGVVALGEEGAKREKAVKSATEYADFIKQHGQYYTNPGAAETIEAQRLYDQAHADRASVTTLGQSKEAQALEGNLIGERPGSLANATHMKPTFSPVQVGKGAADLSDLQKSVNNRILTPVPGQPVRKAEAKATPPAPASAPRVTETRVLPDGRKIEMLSDGTKRLAQ
jgi:hypothetical protein